MNIQFRTVVARHTVILALTTTRFVSSGGFFNKRARESSLANASLGAFPPIPIASRNAKLKRAVDFVRASRLFFHGAIYKCYDDFNRTDGAVLRLQNGNKMNMAKAIILAIFRDHPNAFVTMSILRKLPSVARCRCELLAT